VNLRRFTLVFAMALGLTVVTPSAEVAVSGDWISSAVAGRPKPTAKQKREAKARAKKREQANRKTSRRATGRKRDRVAKVKLCTETRSGKRTKRRCSFVREFQGRTVASATLRTEPLERPSGEIWLGAANLREETKVNIYKSDGSYDENALARLDELFRCKRTGEVRSVDPHLYEHLSRIYDHFGSQKIDLVSGFRFAERNSSRHFHASAMDIRIPGVTIREMYDFANSLDGGGMGIGIYPHSGFVHVDLRAPGDQSYRWTDYSGPNSRNAHRHAKKHPGRTSRAKRPTS
jgi:uncharacterized protein YcbK (DUF882 family)